MKRIATASAIGFAGFAMQAKAAPDWPSEGRVVDLKSSYVSTEIVFYTDIG